jgi:cell shape-determining protein MreC
MVLAAVMALLPVAWTSWVRGLVQLVGLPQWAVSGTGRYVADAADPGPIPSAAEFSRLIEENARLERLVAGQEAWLADLETRFDEVSGLRGQLGELGGQIVIAPVLGYDASPRRETLLIGRGSLSGVREGLWVAAGTPAAERNPERTGRQLLLEQWLVGRVTEVHTRVSRVLLATDPQFGAPQAGEPVSLARIGEDGGWQTTAARYVLSGRGHGRMEITRADADYRSLGFDLVLVPASMELPTALSIGRITGSERLPESALHYNLSVELLGDPRRVSYVYVIVPGP